MRKAAPCEEEWEDEGGLVVAPTVCRSGIDLPAVIVTGEPGLQQALRRRRGGQAIQAAPAVCR